MLFEVNGVSLTVTVSDQQMKTYGIYPFQPSAVVLETGEVFTTTAFTKLSSVTQYALLTHEAGHIACGHLKKYAGSTELVIDPSIEAEADAWASAIVGETAFDEAITECLDLTISEIESLGYVFPAEEILSLENEMHIRIKNRKEVMEKNHG